MDRRAQGPKGRRMHTAPPVTSTPADVTPHLQFNLLRAGIFLPLNISQVMSISFLFSVCFPSLVLPHLEERTGRHDHTRATEATLSPCMFHQRLLERAHAGIPLLDAQPCTWMGCSPCLLPPSPSTVVMAQPWQESTGTRHWEGAESG